MGLRFRCGSPLSLSMARWGITVVLSSCAALAWPSAAEAATVVLDDFEDVADWTGLEPESSLVQQGAGAGRWSDVIARTSVRKQLDPPLDLSGPEHLGFWLHSAVANGQTLQLVFMSDDAATSGSDYYSTALTLDFSGWRFVWLAKSDLGASRSPLGWDQIQSVSLSADGWGHTPLADTDLVLDHMVFADGVVSDVRRTQRWSGADFVYTWVLELREPDGAPLGVDVACDGPSELTVSVDPTHVDLPASGTDSVTVDVTLPAAVIAAGSYESHQVRFIVTHGSSGLEGWDELVANPPTARDHPRVLLTGEDFARIDTWAAQPGWAQSRRDRIVDRAAGWPADFLSEYGLGTVALPPEGGQWGMHYVCPTHGLSLSYEPPMTHRCPVDGEQFSGWPYDQVIYARQHNDLASAARDAGLAYQLTGDVAYAQQAAQILIDYAAAYQGYPLHDTQGGASSSSARVLSQTLDESGWLLKMAWAYDLVADSGEVGAAEQSAIEQGLLRASAATVMRHDAGLSNWQAWHNAGIAAAGRAIGDPRLVAYAVFGPSGFQRHMADSVLSDGFWYEGSWGYHFYTLSPMTYLAEMGERCELDLYAEPALQSMYTAPVLFAPPDLVLPAFNDSGAVDLRGSAGWRLDAAYRAYQDPQLALPLLGEGRDEEALFWGAETLPIEAPAVTESLLFDASGFAVLRGGTVGDPWYLALDYGPHGGWHGHFDKLGYVFFARGEMLAIDPGSHSYALPLHDSWDRSTLAHNTVIVDEADQAEATGELERFLPSPGCTWARAAAGEAYESATLERDFVMVDGYLLDRFEARATDGQEHRYDWLVHNPGELSHDRSTAPYDGFPSSGGYQHLAGSEAEQTDEDARFTFRFAADTTYPGGYWASEDGVVAESSYADAEQHGGGWSNQLHYDFSAAPGAYITFRTRTLSAYTEEAPTAVAVWIRGDGSGNRYALRVVDGTGESHVTEGATLDFTDWREAAFDVDGSWSHWGGDDDGVIDLPLDNLVLQLTHEAGGSAVGDLYLDDWRLTFPSTGEVVVEDFERLVAQELLWIKGASNATYVAGEGIGPDLTVPVPFAMVRRQGRDASFHALHVPHGSDGPAVESFEVASADAPDADRAVGYRIAGTDPAGEAYDDALLIVGRGSGTTARSFGDHETDGVLAWVRHRDDGTLGRLTLAEGSYVADGTQQLYVAPAAMIHVAFALEPGAVEIVVAETDVADSRLLAPATTSVTYQGEPVTFTQDGDYVVFGSIAEPPAGSDAPAPEEDGGCDCSVPTTSRPIPTGWLAALVLLLRRRRRR